MLLAASTGIVGATVVTMGLISLPTMLRYNYDKGLACGSIAASGTLGQIIPPSIVLVILGDTVGSNEYQTATRQQINSETPAGGLGPRATSQLRPPRRSSRSRSAIIFAGAMIPGLMLVGLYMALPMFGVAMFTQPEACRRSSRSASRSG